MKKRNLLISIGLILAVTFTSYFPSLKNEFVNRDDNSYVTENPLIMELSWENIKTIFDTSYMGHYHPLTLLSFSIEYVFFKLNPFIYHATNLTLHLCNSLLVFWFIFLLTDNLLPSLIVALFFGVHPMHVESVAWVSERKDVLYSLFFLGSTICYLFYRRTKKMKYYYLLFFFFVLSILSKIMAITLPLVLLLLDYLLNQKFDKNLLIKKIPFFLIAIFFGWIAFSIPGSMGGTKQADPLSSFGNIFVFSDISIFYLTKLILPYKLACIYPSPRELITPWPYIYLYLPILIGLIIAFSILTKDAHKMIFGLLFFFITIAPALPLKIAADRYTYIPFIGIFYIFGEVILSLYRKRIKDSWMIRIIFSIVLVAIIGIFSFLTWERGKVWKDSLTLWNDVIKKYPNLPKAFASRGEAYSDIGQYDQAILDYTEAIEITPKYADAYYNRGNAYSKNDMLDQAILDYTKAIEIKPNYAEAYYNRGNAYGKKKKFDQAISDYTKALVINPHYVGAYTNRGSIYYVKRQYEQAISDFNEALKINPNYSLAYFNKALACETVGQLWDAVQAYKGFIRNAEPQQSQQIEIAQERIKEISSRFR